MNEGVMMNLMTEESKTSTPLTKFLHGSRVYHDENDVDVRNIY